MMADHKGDHISTPEAHELVNSLMPAAEELGFMIVPEYPMNLLVWANGPDGLITQAPHDIPGELLAGHLPSGPGADALLRLIIKSWKIFENHPVNIRRTKMSGPSQSCLAWGQGRRQDQHSNSTLSFRSRAAVDLVRYESMQDWKSFEAKIWIRTTGAS
jgi:2,3-bisphosphoglycerate-independent phosphoglycerate mutase